MLTVLSWIVVFGVLVAVHELGHFLMAKTMGMRVDEYSLGFGPHLFSHRFGQTAYSIRIIPLGGYVRLAGMDGEKSADPNEFPNRPLWQRFIVIFAGPVMNLVLAFILYAILFGPVGIPVATTTVLHLLPHYPAQLAGIRPGDRIVSIDGTTVRGWKTLDALIKEHGSQVMRIGVERGHRHLSFLVKGRWNQSARHFLIGIQPTSVLVHQGLGGALVSGIGHTVQLTGLWFTALFQLVTGHSRFDVTGPVGIAVMVGQAARAGLANLLLLAAALSANLGLFNILPIPVLDGSRLFLLAVEGVRRRALDPEKESMIHLVGMALLLVFVAFVTYHDIVHYLHLG